MAKFEVKGLDRLIERLNKLPDDVVKKLVKGSLPDALQPFKEEVQKNAPVDTGALKDAVQIAKPKLRRNKVFANVTIGENNLKNNKGEQFYASFQEFGWESNGVVHPGTHFMERAFQARKEEVAQNVIDKLNAAIDDATKKS